MEILDRKDAISRWVEKFILYEDALNHKYKKEKRTAFAQRLVREEHKERS